ncbi:hypothetical protein U9M48_026569 [Paspalum notatum var. saurae]|uniref:Uncharacterized protein n=1 Tax=Paspalum notatum var. saurae TaxID=547442 RepID=A0AAQ3TSJ8_PASNO
MLRLPFVKHQVAELCDRHASNGPARSAAGPDKTAAGVTEDQVAIPSELEGGILPHRAKSIGRPDHLWDASGRHGDAAAAVGVDDEDGEEESIAAAGRRRAAEPRSERRAVESFR